TTMPGCNPVSRQRPRDRSDQLTAPPAQSGESAREISSQRDDAGAGRSHFDGTATESTFPARASMQVSPPILVAARAAGFLRTRRAPESLVPAGKQAPRKGATCESGP